LNTTVYIKYQLLATFPKTVHGPQVENHWPVRWVSSTLSGACRGLMMPWATTWLCAPLRNCSIEECGKHKHSKTTCPGLCHVQTDYATKTSPHVRIKKRKSCSSLKPRDATLARYLNVVKRTCKDTELCMALMTRKKVKYVAKS